MATPAVTMHMHPAFLALAALIALPAAAVARSPGPLSFPAQDAYGAVVSVAGPDGEAPPVPLRAFLAGVAAQGFPDTVRGAVTVVFVRRAGPLPEAMRDVEARYGLPGTVVVRVDANPDHAPLVDFAGDVTPVADLSPVVAAYGPLSADGFAVGDPGVVTDSAEARGWTGSGDLESTTSIASPERYPTPTGAPLVVTCSVPHDPATGPCVATYILAGGVTAMADGSARRLPPNATEAERKAAALSSSPGDRARAAQAVLALMPLLVRVR